MFLEYQKAELKRENNFNTIYNGLKTGLVLLAAVRPIRTEQDFAFAGKIELDGGFLRWNHYGSSAERVNKKSLHFLFTEIFDDCDFFALVDSETYSAKACAYYESEIAKRTQAQA